MTFSVSWVHKSVSQTTFSKNALPSSRGIPMTGRRLSTWQMIDASCPTALGALCRQLTCRLAWCHEHSAVTATEL